MAKSPETILIALKKGGDVKVGLPPKGRLDIFENRAQDCGKLEGVYRVASSPDGELYCVRDGDLFVGPLPSSRNKDWFSAAKRVGRSEWYRAYLIRFHPNGDMYVVTMDGDLYKGPKPDNENVPWFYDRATLVESKNWAHYVNVFFDFEDSLYAVTTCHELLKGPVPKVNCNWYKTTKKIGQNYWKKFKFFIAISSDGKLWCVDRDNGNLYRGDPPSALGFDYLTYAEHLGWSYNNYELCTFSVDKTIRFIRNFKFLPEKGQKKSENPVVIAEKTYDNRNSTNVMKHKFTYSKTLKESSSFENAHSFTIGAEMETTFKGGLPHIAENETKISISTSTTHEWKFNETNEREVTIASETDVEIEAGKYVKMTATMISAEIDVPYQAEIETLFGSIVTIDGTWRGMTHYSLSVTQVDLK